MVTVTLPPPVAMLEALPWIVATLALVGLGWLLWINRSHLAEANLILLEQKLKRDRQKLEKLESEGDDAVAEANEARAKLQRDLKKVRDAYAERGDLNAEDVAKRLSDLGF